MISKHFTEGVHLQWFSDVDTGEAPPIEFSEEDDIEIVDGLFVPGDEPEPANAGPTPEELQQQLNALTQQNQALTQRLEDRDSSQQNIQTLGKTITESLQGLAQPKQEATKGPSPEDFIKDYNDQVYDKPLEANAKLVNAIIGQTVLPKLDEISRQLQQTATVAGRQNVGQGDTQKLVMELYGDEVKKIVDSGNGGVNAWNDAVNSVTLAHVTELVDEMAKRKAASEDSSAEPNNLQPGNLQNTPKAPPKPVKKQMSAAQAAYADKIGLDRKMMQSMLATRGLLGDKDWEVKLNG